MAVEEGWSFTLPECPESVCYSPSTNSLIACGKEGKISCYDLISGQQLCEAGKITSKCTLNNAHLGIFQKPQRQRLGVHLMWRQGSSL